MSRLSQCALTLVLAVAACGRSGIDGPLDPTVIPDQGGGGNAGAGGQAGAAGANPIPCAKGAKTCAGMNAVEICMGGVWKSFHCPGGGSCVDGACVGGFNLVFITSQTFAGGNLGGLDGADAICQRLADAAKLPGQYRAWLSDTTGSPATRFTKSGGTYRLIDGALIANDWIDLTSGELRHPISVTESGGAPRMTRLCDSTHAWVWTDTASAGTLVAPESSCDDWSNTASGSLLVGRGDVMDVTWSYACGGIGNPTPDCASAASLYCFQQ